MGHKCRHTYTITYSDNCLQWPTLHPDQCCPDTAGVLSSEGQSSETKTVHTLTHGSHMATWVWRSHGSLKTGVTIYTRTDIVQRRLVITAQYYPSIAEL